MRVNFCLLGIPTHIVAVNSAVFVKSQWQLAIMIRSLLEFEFALVCRLWSASKLGIAIVIVINCHCEGSQTNQLSRTWLLGRGVGQTSPRATRGVRQGLHNIHSDVEISLIWFW